jgi:plastocyanin
MSAPVVRSPLRAITVGTACLAAVVWLGAAWISSSAATPGPAAITMKNFMFSPVPLNVTAGSTVTWTNLDDEPHTAVSDTGLFRSGAIDTNESFTFKFDKPGTYHFTCSIHPRMVGTIIVQ